jgi:acetyl-CoA C-acetyltransferase
MNAHSHKIVLCGGWRTPIGHIARSLAGIRADDLMTRAVHETVTRVGVPKGEVDGLIAGWVGQDFQAPNLARVVVLRAGLPERAQAVTVQNNCISSIEAVAMAARFILAGDGELYVAGGVEVMSRLPYSIAGSRASKELRSLATVKEKWAEVLASPDVAVVDSIEQGLTDPVRGINMAATAEIAAQTYGVGREEQDAYAHESFKRTLAGWKRGFYAGHVFPVKEGDAGLDTDEYPFLREDLVEKPAKFGKAPVAFDRPGYSIQDFLRDNAKHMNGKAPAPDAKATVTLFNSCGRSDGAAAVIVATEARAKALKLPILAELKGWGFYGNDPAHMGVSPALAAPVALKAAGAKFEDLDQIELHEPFAATVLSIFKLGKERFGHDWEAKFKGGAMNPNGGTLALGHPLGATGARLLLNLLGALKENPRGKLGMIAACAGGGMGGALVVEKA